MANVFDVAYHILEKQGKMTTMKLQKLCYYAQAWSLVWEGKPLFEDEFEAWTNGPVCKTLFDAHKGKFHIEKNDIIIQSTLTESERETIDAVLDVYGNKDPQWLSTLTHLERPWNEARTGYADGENCSEIITNDSMKEYYGSL